MSKQQDFTDKIVLTYPCTGKEKEWHLTEAKLTEYKDVYDTIDVERECKHALQWIRSNPLRRKTFKGMDRFLCNWLTKAVNSGRGAQKQSKPDFSFD